MGLCCEISPSDCDQGPGVRATILLRAEWRDHGLPCRRCGFESNQPSAGRVSWRQPILSSVTGQEHAQEKSQMCGILDLEGPGKSTSLSPRSTNERPVSRGSEWTAQRGAGLAGPGNQTVFGCLLSLATFSGPTRSSLSIRLLGRLCLLGVSPLFIGGGEWPSRACDRKQWLEPESIALSQSLQGDLCRAADFLQLLFHGACGLKGGSLAAFRKLSTERNGGGGGEEGGRVVELEEEGGRSGRDASRGLRTRV